MKLADREAEIQAWYDIINRYIYVILKASTWYYRYMWFLRPVDGSIDEKTVHTKDVKWLDQIGASQR